MPRGRASVIARSRKRQNAGLAHGKVERTIPYEGALDVFAAAEVAYYVPLVRYALSLARGSGWRSDGYSLFGRSYQLGQPQSLLSRPVIEAVDMPSIASGTFPIAFGDCGTAYRIYDKANGFSVLRDPYSVATKGLVRFHARRRVGGQVSMAEACKKLKMSVS